MNNRLYRIISENYYTYTIEHLETGQRLDIYKSAVISSNEYK